MAGFEQLQKEPLYRPLWSLLHRMDWRQPMPDVDQLNALRAALDIKPVSASGAKIRFETARGRTSALAYETAIFRDGRVATRASNWHDFFNALVWLRFARCKAVINALHCADTGVGRRSEQRDFATLLDESGVLVAYDDPRYIELLGGRQWHQLFLQRRDQLAEHVRFFVFGHALYEKALSPYPGLTGKVLALHVPTEFLALEYNHAVDAIDALAAAYLADKSSTATPPRLLPLPIFGVPGWSADQNEAFYADVRYFRPPRPVCTAGSR